MAMPAKLVPSLLMELPTRLDRAPERLGVVEPPTSPSAPFALSRFEFETGKGNEGTKILMVEWNSSALLPAPSGLQSPKSASPSPQTNKTAVGDWEVSWEGKTTVLPQLDMEAEIEGGPTRRVYFLLPPGASIPPLVTISQLQAAGPVLRTKPMPAIFAALDDGIADQAGAEIPAGRHGVLHTLWAKSRLRALTDEVEMEMRTNGESVGLEMALQERQWIMHHFALDSNGELLSASGATNDAALEPRADLHAPPTPRSPTSPRGRLGEKLRGLKLATSPTELAAALQAAKGRDHDVAVSSFATYPGPKDAHSMGNGGVTKSLNASVAGRKPARAAPANEGGDQEEDLFALPMSPRSPEMKKSPFSLL